jgi:hypothetical protein
MRAPSQKRWTLRSLQGSRHVGGDLYLPTPRHFSQYQRCFSGGRLVLGPGVDSCHSLCKQNKVLWTEDFVPPYQRTIPSAPAEKVLQQVERKPRNRVDQHLCSRDGPFDDARGTRSGRDVGAAPGARSGLGVDQPRHRGTSLIWMSLADGTGRPSRVAGR